MCGIVAYVGGRTAYPILVNGLQRLEYRGYDSAGIALYNGEIRVYKCKGRVRDLQSLTADKNIDCTLGMGHTRWATHGEPSDANAHPHASMHDTFHVVHNGIIENHAHLRAELTRRGYVFRGETDTEVLANLIEDIYNEQHVSAELAVRLALTRVVGAYGLVVLCADEPGRLFAARKGSPLVVGIGPGEYFLASDATPIIEYTDRVVYLNDEEVAVITPDSLDIKDLYNDVKTPEIKTIKLSIENVDKGPYPHYMLKEIHEQPCTVRETYRGRVAADASGILLGGILDVMPRLIAARRAIIVACGTSWHAALVGEHLFERYARLPVEVEYASEFRYRDPIVGPGDVVIAISQSGETADTLAAIHLVKNSGATLLGICNVAGSSISRETEAGIYTRAGIEIGVASTKAFTSQITALAMIAFLLGSKRRVLSPSDYHTLVSELSRVPALLAEALLAEPHIRDIAYHYKDSRDALYLGRGPLFPVALEGALKLKEISYIHAEGYPAAEMKHGPIALVDAHLPVIVLVPNDRLYEKTSSNLHEVKTRGGQIIAIVTRGNTDLNSSATHVIEIPPCHEALLPLLAVIPLQLFAYHLAVARGCDVDQPRNLAKAVTVE
jgi:glucosamine--fructose-6-phosphate aminotransferase (isomerizing)